MNRTARFVWPVAIVGLLAFSFLTPAQAFFCPEERGQGDGSQAHPALAKEPAAGDKLGRFLPNFLLIIHYHIFIAW